MNLPASAAFPPRKRLGVLVWIAAMIGAVTIVLQMLPGLMANLPLPAPLPVLMLLSIAQSALLFGLASWGGAALAHRVGLSAPVFEAVAASRPVGPALRPQLVPGLAGGIVGGLGLAATALAAPDALIALQDRFNPPLLARVLYGGISEEVLLRWGLLSVLLYLLWRFLQRRAGPPGAAYVWAAIAISSLVFGVGHLPAAAALLGSLTTDVVVFVVVANTTFGFLFGWLYCRYGLESAMIAHAVAHLFGFALTPLVR